MEPMQEPMQEPMGCEDLIIKPGLDNVREDKCKGDADFYEPIHLLTPSADHASLVLNPAALRRLSAIGSVSVLSVVGNQRGGKSTLMNLLHSRRLSGFQTGHFMDPQTYGVWVWPRPHPRRPGHTILLVDSEGLDSPQVPQHYNWLVSAVTLMMSDVFMYQTKGSIEQSSAERLDMILKVAEQLSSSESDSKNGATKSGRCAFIWLLRDHQLQMRGTPKEELAEKLESSHLKALRETFVEYDCVPLPRPANDETLKRLDKHGFDDLSADFREEFVVFERRLFDLLSKPRSFLGESLTGEGLAELLRQYLSAIGRRDGILGQISQMPTQSELFRNMLEKRIIESAVKHYETQLQQLNLSGSQAQLPVAPAVLLDAHAAARRSSLHILEKEGCDLGLSAAQLTVIQDRFDKHLATWTTVQRIAIGTTPGSHPTLQQQAPSLLQTPELSGGLLWTLWQENARCSSASFSAHCDRVAKTRNEPSVKASLEEGDGIQAVNTLYASLRDTLDVQDGKIGPWGAGLLNGSCGSRSESSVLLDVIRQGDELVAEIVKATSSRIREEMRAEMVEKLAEERSSLGSQFESALSDVRSQCAEEITAIKASVQEIEVQNKRDEERKALQAREQSLELERRFMDISKEVQASVKDSFEELETKMKRRLQDQDDAMAEHARQRDDLKHAMDALAQEAMACAKRSTDEARDECANLQSSVSALKAVLEERVAEIQECFRNKLTTSEAAWRDALDGAKSELKTHTQTCVDTADQRNTDQLKSSSDELWERVLSSHKDLESQIQQARDATQALQDDVHGQLDSIKTRFGEAIEARDEKMLGHETSLAKLSERLDSELASSAGASKDDVQRQIEASRAETVAQLASIENQSATACEAAEQATRAATEARDALKEIQMDLNEQLSGHVTTCNLREQEGKSRFDTHDEALRSLSANVTQFKLQVDEAGEEQKKLLETLAKLQLQADETGEEQRRLLDTLAKQDLNAIWESFAHLATQLGNLQLSFETHVRNSKAK
eukprot:TRINITY_DN23955_c0_g2_i2.p1 TRINITY_DN23955_c0_g2~~TRINITY_DN23955_c0_g2_i2.p1  ORF type:complete len:1015 (+),score=152.55 TRINITY_DN23955_c0_g2_i2:96-3140(+)